jgi:two-component system CheB/CheR fusion protein
LVARGNPRDSSAFTLVGIGASAGGLEACRKFVEALPVDTGMAFLLVQHLDPTHESMMVDLLADHTSMNVRQAMDGMLIERDHLYVIPPGNYLAVGKGDLHLSKPLARQGARLPFDFLLHSMAEECGARAICVILSGTGADGSLGLKAVKAASSSHRTPTRPATMACRAARSRPARWTLCLRRRRFPTRSSNMTGR